MYELLGRWYGRLPYAGAKLQGTVEIVDIDEGKTFCHVRFMILHMFVMYAHLILFSAMPNTGVDSILPLAGRMSRRTVSGQGNLKQRYINLICTSGKCDP